MMKKQLITILLLGICCTVQSPAANSDPQTESFTVNNAIQSNMVVQQNKELVVWGHSKTGKSVSVKASWSQKAVSSSVGTDGFWECRIPVPEVRPGKSEAHTLMVVCGDKRLTYQNILIGEVWFLSGQSNMEMTMQPSEPWHHGVENWQAEVAAADVPLLRFITSARVQADEPCWNGTGTWRVCSPTTAGEMSGVGYYFAKKLIAELNIPVGLVITSHGSMSAQMYTSMQTLAASPILKAKYLQPFLDNPESIAETNRPSRLYNGMIYPFRKVSMRGVLWYQGESNAGDHTTYDLLMLNMLREWRTLFEQGELPFYYVQVVPYAWLNESDPDPTMEAFHKEDYAFFRENQSRLRDETNHCEMVTAMDVGAVKMAHSRKKRPVGERLARIALARDYHCNIVFHAPRFRNFRIENKQITVSFDHLGAGLRTSDGKAPRHFFVAGRDRKFYAAQAEIRSDRIVLSCPQVPEPASVRYAFLTFPITNLESFDGLSVEPFRTDEWPAGSTSYAMNDIE